MNNNNKKIVRWSMPQNSKTRFSTNIRTQSNQNITDQVRGLGSLDGKMSISDSCWSPQNNEIRVYLPALRAISRALSNNDPFAKKYQSMLVDNVIGAGGVYHRSQAVDRNGEQLQDIARKLENDFWSYASNPKLFDARQQVNFVEFQRLVERTRSICGECFIRYKNGSYRIIDAALIDTKFNQDLGNGSYIQMGIEFNADDIPIAYHVNQLANKMIGSYSAVSKRERVPADEMIHYFEPLFYGQVRGLPDLTPVAKLLSDLGKYRDSQLASKYIQSALMGFVEQEETDSFDDEEIIIDQLSKLDPGTINYLAPGQKITPFASTVRTDDPAYYNQIASTIAAGLGVFVNSLTSDCSNVNYSSARFGSLTEWGTVKTRQDRLIMHVLTPIYEFWLRDKLAQGYMGLRFSDFEGLKQCQWIAKKQVSIDPSKDLDAIRTKLELGLMSKQQAMIELGLDPAVVNAQLQQEAQEKINTSTENNNNNNGTSKDENKIQADAGDADSSE